jgi:hypothetical protein
MKILVDENIPRMTVDRLREQPAVPSTESNVEAEAELFSTLAAEEGETL